MLIQDDVRLMLINAHQASLRREAAYNKRTCRAQRGVPVPSTGYVAPVVLVVRALHRRGHEARGDKRRVA